jgi:murein DD-endopeptidase MepM/ murein hydrolase activator NlpD
MKRALFLPAGLVVLAILLLSGNCFATPHFLLLPFKDTSIKLQQGWVYTFDTGSCNHQGVDFIKGTIDQSATWQTFEIYPAADGEATLHVSDSYGDYVTVKHTINGTTYYTLYAHLDKSQRKLRVEAPITVTRNTIIGMAGKSGSASRNVLHLHFELSIGGYARSTSCPTLNFCGNCRLDPYGIYGLRSNYPPNVNCTTADYYWTQCTPTTVAQNQGDFSLPPLNPQTITQGDTARFQITLLSITGFTGNVSLQGLNLPNGYDASHTTMSPSAVYLQSYGTMTATLTIATSRTTQTGRSTITIKASSGALTKTQNVDLTINPAPIPPARIDTVTLPNTLTSGHQFIALIRGGNIDPSSVRVVVVGPGCPSFGACVVPNNVLRQFGAITAGQINAVPLTLGVGSYQIYIQNGTGPASNGYVIVLRR